MESAEDEIEDIQMEIKILSQLDSEFCTKYYGTFLQQSKLYIVMEFCGGGSCLDLVLYFSCSSSIITFHTQIKSGPIDEVYAAVILREVLKGLEYLHENGKLHRDVKAANVLLTVNGDVKLADFVSAIMHEFIIHT